MLGLRPPLEANVAVVVAGRTSAGCQRSSTEDELLAVDAEEMVRVSDICRPRGGALASVAVDLFFPSLISHSILVGALLGWAASYIIYNAENPRE